MLQKPVKVPNTTTPLSCRDAYNPSEFTHSTPKPFFKVSKPHKKPWKTHPKVLGPPSAHLTLSAHETTITASPFLRLPGEIRNMIYTYALSSPKGYLRYSKAVARFDVLDIGVGLLIMCYFVAFETLYLPPQLNRLVFEPPTHADFGTIKMIGKLIKLTDEVGWGEG
jgi:hypothetical protein